MFRSLLVFFLFLSFAGNSQRPISASNPPNLNSGSISGVLIDSITGSFIEYAAVGILDQVSGQVVNGSLTDAEGKFKVNDLAITTYKIQVSFIGYASRTIENVSLTGQKPHVYHDKIILSPESQLLEEIRIVGEGALIEARPDKIVYNAERDVTTAGGDASDVLRKVPLLTVDFDGNVSMRGSENVKILINGRPSGMFSANVGDALKMMPADQIKSVEIITSPSAKYDGEGTAGIINIITRKKNVEGVAGSVDLTAGTRSHRANGNINYGRGRFGFNISGGGHYNIPQEGSTSFRREETGTTQSLLLQEGTSKSSRLGFRSNASVEYNINAANTINSSFSLRGFENTNLNQINSEYTFGGNRLDAYNRLTDGTSLHAGWDWEMDYKHIFPKKDQEFSMAFEIDKDGDQSDHAYEQVFVFPTDLPSLRENNINNSDNLEITLQADYVHPVNSRFTLETGVKGTLRKIESDFRFNLFDPDLGTWNEDPARTDVFFYDQNVYAAYGSGNFSIGEKINVITGARLETTELQGRFMKFESPFDNQYLSFLPNITISKKTGEFNLLKISYNQRIQRPGQRHINPFIEYNDARDISFGNPLLFPESVHQVEIGSTFFIKSNMISTSLFARRTNDLIESLLTISDDGISESTFYNFGNREALGMNVFGSLNLGKLSLRGGFDVNAWKVKGDFENQFLSNSGYDFNGRMNITWILSETLKVEGFSFYRSPTYTVQGKIPNWWMMSFGVKKELFKKRLSVGLNFTEPFRENHIMVKELEGPGFYQYSRTSRPIRSFGINLGYRFGKLDFNERSGKKRVNNNDLKEDDQGNEPNFQ